MRRAKLLMSIGVVLLVGSFAIVGCAPQANNSSSSAAATETDDSSVAATGLRPLADWQSDPSMDPSEFSDAIYGAYDDRASEYPAKIITYDDGTQAQITPTPSRDSTAQVRDYISWNTYRLDADNRGCQACHDDMATLVQTMGDSAHTDISNTLGMDVTVIQCIDCHNSHLGGRYESQFSGLIHEIHGSKNEMFEEKGGDCWSCHYGVTANSGIGGTSTDSEGLHLWEKVKHNVLRGINTIDSESFTGEFTVDQDYVEGADAKMWSNSYVRQRGEEVSAIRWAHEKHGDVPDPSTDGVYDSWEITISAEGGQSTTMSLQEMIDTIGAETTIMTAQCLNNGENGSYITNREITGIPLQKIAEYVGGGELPMLEATASDGRTAEIGMDFVRENAAYLVYEISGEPISYADGYPCQIWVGNWIADENNKGVVDLAFAEGEWEPSLWRGDLSTKDGLAGYAPNVGICYLHEGQLINLGEEFTFQGYAATYVHTITDVEISMDHGKTWQTFETPNQDPTKWTWWNFSYTPEAEGSCCIMVRAHDDGGYETPEPVEIMFNVVDPNAASEAK